MEANKFFDQLRFTVMTFVEREQILRLLPAGEKVLVVETSEFGYKHGDYDEGMVVEMDNDYIRYYYHQLTCKSIELAITILK